MEAARARAGPADIAGGRPLADLRRAETRFAAAHARLQEPAWLPARALPVVGRQLRSASALSSAALEAARVGIDSVTQVERLLAGGSAAGPPRVALLREFADLAQQAETRLAAVSLGPRRKLIPPLARRRDQFAGQLDELREALRRGAIGGRAFADFLNGPRRYLVFAANNAEMRAGSGMFLSVGEMEARDGILQMGPMTTVETMTLPPGAVALHGDLADRWGWLRPNEDWRNLMLSPRFDVSAELATRMWVALGRPPVDGVIALDPVVLQALLEAAGPVRTAAGTITPENVVEQLLHDQYLQFPEDWQIADRREQLGEIATAALAAVNGERLSLPSLAGGVARAVRGRHLLVWSSRPEEQSAWVAAGVDGGLRSDSLLVSLLNRGGTKLDRFVHVSADLSFQPDGPDTSGTLRLRIENRVPPGEPAYVAGPREGSGVGKDVYLGIVTATLPGFARDIRIEGVDQLAVAGPDGPTRVVGFQITVPPAEARDVVVRFRLPGPQGSLVVEPTARIPPTQWTAAGRTWADEGSHRVPWRTGGERA